MDPDANLAEALRIAHVLVDEPPADISSESRMISREELIDILDSTERLAELVIALDEWIRKGGILPFRWVGREL